MAISRSDMERQLRKDGGILTLDDARKMAPPGESLAYINPEEAALLKSLGGAGEDINGTGIKSYFLKKVFRKAKNVVKKVVKSPIGKAAILGGLTFGVPGTGFKGFLGAGKGGGLGSFIKNKLLGTGALGDFGGTGSKGLLRSLGLTKGGYGSFGGLTGLGKIAGIGGASGLAGLLAAGEADEEDEIDFSKLDRGEGIDFADILARARKGDSEFRFLPSAQFTDTYAEGGKVDTESDEYIMDNEESQALFGKFPIQLSLKEQMMLYGRKKYAEGGGIGSLAMNKENVKQKFISDEAGAIAKKGGGVTPEDMGKLKRNDFNNEENYKRYLRQLNRKAEGGSPVTDDDLEKVVRDFNKQAELSGQPFMTLKELKKILGSKKGTKYKVGKAEGGIMDLGGNEMDLRGGGFVPLGAKEKADDVPARLSKNEFVMTADAVRAAGGGSVDKGADKMYNMMKNLEAQV